MLPGIRRDESLARLEVARCNEPDRLALAPIPGLLRRRRAEDAVRRARPREDLAHERHERKRRKSVWLLQQLDRVVKKERAALSSPRVQVSAVR